MTPLPQRRRSHGLALLLVVVALVAAGCGSSNPSSAAGPASPSSASAPTTAATAAPSPTKAAVTCDPNDTATAPPSSPDASDPNAATYAEIEAQVSQLRGLTATKPIGRSTFDQAGLCAFIRTAFRRDNPEAVVSGTEKLLKGLLLLPQDDSLESLYLDMLSSQVIGLYDDKTRTMYVVTETGQIGPTEEITYAHEYTHALQDQAFDLSRIQGTATDQGDRALARTTLIEGDATLLMSLWAQQNLTPAQLLSVAGAADPASAAALERIPPILKETLLFPYMSGLQLTLSAFQQGGYAGVDALFANPPDSTEQILHADKLASREAPVKVSFPGDLATRLGSGWSVALQDTLGELQLGLLLQQTGGLDEAAANTAAAGWGGDRVAVVEGPNGAEGIVLDTVWDTDADATEFSTALANVMTKLQAAGRSASVLMPATNRVVLVTADSDGTLSKLANVLGLAG
jgi:hypothetical protein